MGKNNKLDKKSKQLIVGIFSVLILVTFSLVMIIAAMDMSETKHEEDTTDGFYNTDAAVTKNNLPSANNNVSTTLPNNSANTTTLPGNSVTQDSYEEPISVEGLGEFTKTGENQISDSPKNKYIKLVTDNYDVEPEYLVAIYAVPDLGNNFVLEFNNKRDENGNVIKSPKTLKKVYHINQEQQIKIATGKPTGNVGVDYGTSIMTYYLVTDVVMPEFPDYFTDVS